MVASTITALNIQVHDHIAEQEMVLVYGNGYGEVDKDGSSYIKKAKFGFLMLILTVLTLNIAFSIVQPVPRLLAKSRDRHGLNSDADLWRFIREGNSGDVSMKNELAAVMIQSEGDNWRAVRNGPISIYGAAGVLGMIFLLAIFYSWRGRIKIDSGPSGKTIERFGSIDRFAHWLMAGSFVILAVTGLNLLYSRYILLPIMGPEAFSLITTAGKFAHNYLAFAFMAGLALSFLLWVRHNIPSKD